MNSDTNITPYLTTVNETKHSRVKKGLPLPEHVEHVQPSHSAELLPPQSLTRHDVRLAV